MATKPPTMRIAPVAARCSIRWCTPAAFVHVAIGTLIDDLSIRPAAHIFVGSKAPWFTITDDLPQYVGHVTEPDPGGKT